MNIDYLTSENVALLDRKRQFRDQVFHTPDVLWPFFRKCEVRTLVVADGFLYFNDENFGLSDLIGFITASFSPYASVVVSKAHRNNPSAARLNGAEPNFVFTDEALNNVDVVWLFAANTRGTPPLSNNEVAAIANFMNRGGGVFATGDHEDLGVAMCGEIPRVRSMRKWYFPDPGPNGEPVAPIVCGPNRYDTNRVGYDGTWQFNDQSDDIPQQIQPRYYHSGIFKKHPHPLLCGPGGKTIKVLPDHPHEGECIEPWEPEAELPIDGGFIEYPIGPGGERELPQVVATSTMIPGTGDPNSVRCPGKPPIVGGSFGAVSAYDGHRAEVGRVTCDATWHHFININLTGAIGAPPPKDMGFLASVQGQQHLEDIKAYFRNIALWLAPRKLQRCIFLRKLLFETTPGSIIFEELQPNRLNALTDWRDLSRFGGFFRDIFKLNKNVCEELDLPEFAPIELRAKLGFLKPLPIPDAPPLPFEQIMAESAFQAGLGSAVKALAMYLEDTTIKDMSTAAENKLLKVLDNGFVGGFRLGLEGLLRDIEETQSRLAKQLDF